MYTNFSLRTAIVLFLGLMIASCGVKARVDIYMEPVVSGDEYLDTKTGAITLEKEGVSITVKPLDTSDLLMLTDDEDINPYINVSWRHANPLYTVFDVNIHNKRESKVVVDSPAILIDENGEQYASLPYDYFKDIYGAAYRKHTEIVYPYYWYGYSYPYFYPPYYVRRVSNENVQERRLVARETIFDGAKLFSGAKRNGLLVFERLDEGATDVRLVIPEVVVYDGKRKHKLNFEFNFRQVVSVK